MNWISDNSVHWSDGHTGSDSRDNLRTNVTAKVPAGYRAAVDGYIYMATVDGKDNITNVSLYSRPVTSSRKDWKKGETTRQTQARALVQAQLNAKKAAAAAAAKKAADEAAAAEAKRKAEEEARRKQAEWDAAHPIEAAQRDVNNATNLINSARSKIATDNAQIKSNTDAINRHQPEVNQLTKDINLWGAKATNLMGAGMTEQGLQMMAREVRPREVKRSNLQNEINKFKSQSDAIKKDLTSQNNLLNRTNGELTAAQARLKKARTDAEQKRKTEAARQAAEAARVKAEQEAAAKAKAEADAKARDEAEAATKAAALEAARSKLEEPNVFSVKALAASMGAAVSPMTFAETGLGGLTFSSEAATAAWALVRGVVAELLGLATVSSGVGALIAAIGYIPGAGEGSDKVPGRNSINMFSTFLDPSAIGLPNDTAIKAALKANGTVSSKIRGRV